MEKKPVSPLQIQPYVPAPIAPIQQPESPQMMPMPMPAPEYVIPQQQCPPYPIQPIYCPPICKPCCPPIPRPCGCMRPMHHHHHHFVPQVYQPYMPQGQYPWGY
jgi:hypothetical protein